MGHTQKKNADVIGDTNNSGRRKEESRHIRCCLLESQEGQEVFGECCEKLRRSVMEKELEMDTWAEIRRGTTK